MAESLPLILVLPVLLVLSAIASGAETALFRLSHRERADLRRTAPTAGAAVDSLLAQPRRLLLFVLLLNMVVNVTYFVVSSVLTTRAGSPAAAAGVGVGSVLAIVLFGEILAKAIAGAGRRRFCLVLAPPLAVVQVVLDPVVRVVDRYALSPIIRLLRPGDAGPESVGAAELARLVETGRESGVLTDNERRLLAEVIELGQIRVRDAMRPIERIVTLPVDATPEQILEAAASTRRTTILLCTPTLDRGVAGFLHVKRFLAAIHEGEGHDLAPFIERPLYLPEHSRLDTVLEVMRRRATTHALCVDEHGRVIGMIQADDIVDELLVGLADDSGDENPVQLVGLNRWSVSGDLALRDWARHFSVPDDALGPATTRPSTVGGLVVDRLGRLAAVGDAVTVGTCRLSVDGVEGRRISVLGVEVIEPIEPGSDTPSEVERPAAQDPPGDDPWGNARSGEEPGP